MKNDPQLEANRPGTWLLLLSAALFAVIAWTSLGHHRYYLSGDEALNFQLHVRLERDYFQANAAAWSQRQDGVGDGVVPHMSLLEGGFPVFLLLARQFGERAPFMANAILLPFMLLFFAWSIALADAEPRRRFIAALFGLLFLLSFPRASSLVWKMALPFRDTLSHTLGFGGLVVLLMASRRPGRAGSRVFWAGLLTGLSGWTRLSGFLFVFPAAALLLSFTEFGDFKRRVRLILMLGAGTSIGLGLVLAQNLFEGRPLFMVPQADTLLFRNPPLKAGAGGSMAVAAGAAIQKGWNPGNLFLVLPKYVLNVWNTYPDGLNILFLAGTLGWIVASGRKARRLVPLVVGLATFLVFYGCYDKVLSRYLVILLLFHAAIAAVASAWIVDVLLKGVARLGFSRTRIPASAIVLSLAMGIMAAAVHSGPDWAAVQGQWKDARHFRDWLRQNVPVTGALNVHDQGLENWITYFGESRREWWPRLLNGRTIDLSRLTLPDEPVFLLTPFREDPEQFDRGWTRDALLNRYDLEASGEPLRFTSLRFAGVRLFRVAERRHLERDVAVKNPSSPSRGLYLYLRDLTSGRPRQDVVLWHESWPREWPVQVQAGVNLLVLPEDLAARPEQIRLRSRVPLPSVLEAAWMGPGPVAVHLWEYDNIVSRLLQVDGVALHWTGYAKWWRDWGENSAYRASTPRVVAGSSTRVRLPGVFGGAGPRLFLRLSYSAVDPVRKRLKQGYRIRYRIGSETLAPATVVCNPRYPYIKSRATDFMQEVEINPAAFDAAAGGWMDLVFPPPEAGGGPDRLYLHAIDYLLEGVAELPPPAREPRAEEVAARSHWMSWGFMRVPWDSLAVRPDPTSHSNLPLGRTTGK